MENGFVVISDSTGDQLAIGSMYKDEFAWVDFGGGTYFGSLIGAVNTCMYSLELHGVTIYNVEQMTHID